MRLLLQVTLCFAVCVVPGGVTRGQATVTEDLLIKAVHAAVDSTQNDWDSVFEYGVNYFSYADTGKLSSALTQYILSMDSSERFGASVPLMQGIVRIRRRQYDGALNLLHAALKIGLKNTDLPLIYYANIELSLVFQKMGNYPLALLSYNEAMKAASAANNTEAMILAHVKKSELFFELRSFQRSLESLNNAYLLLAPGNVNSNNKLKAVIYKNKIKCFGKLGLLDSLLATKRKLDGLNTNDLFIQYAKTSGNVEASRIQNKYGQEIIDLEKLLKITRATAFEEPLNVAIELARAYSGNGQCKEALQILDSVEYYVSGLNQLGVLRELYVAKASTLLRMNNMAAALNYYEKNERVYDSINVNTTIAKNMDMSVSVSTLKNNLGEAVKEKKLQKKVVIFTVVISILSLIVLFLLFRNVINRSKMHRMQMQQHMKELSFINSHEVRKYLANIMGIVEVIKMEDHPFEVYKLFEDALFKNVDDLDQSIKTLAQKLYGAEGAKEETS